MKYFVPVFLALLLLVGCGTGGEVSVSDPKPKSSPPSISEAASPPSSSKPSPAESGPEESPAPESPASGKEPEPEPDPEPEPQPSASELKNIQPPPVAHGAELENVDFSTMSKEKLVDLLQPVLERAKFFCGFGKLGEIDDIGVAVDFSPEAAILLPQGDFQKDYHPCLNLSYRTVEELKQDMCTVLTPDDVESRFLNIFNNIIASDGRLYVYGGGGYTTERRWELDKMEIVSAEESKITISAPVSWGSSEETIIAPLNFEIKNGYIIMDDSYFATDIS